MEEYWRIKNQCLSYIKIANDFIQRRHAFAWLSHVTVHKAVPDKSSQPYVPTATKSLRMEKIIRYSFQDRRMPVDWQRTFLSVRHLEPIHALLIYAPRQRISVY